MQQLRVKVIPTPSILLFQRRLPLIGAWDIPPQQLHSFASCLLQNCFKARGSGSLYADDNIWPQTGKVSKSFFVEDGRGVLQRQKHSNFHVEEGMWRTLGCGLWKERNKIDSSC